MSDSVDRKPIINLHVLADRLGLPPKDIQLICRRIFSVLSKGEGALGQELRAVAEGTDAEPKAVFELLEFLAGEMRKPVSPRQESLRERASDLADDAREKVVELKDRVSKGVASIDVASLREDGAEKVAELRERAANVDLTEIADQAKELGNKATIGVQGMVERVRSRFQRSERVEPTAKLER